LLPHWFIGCTIDSYWSIVRNKRDKFLKTIAAAALGSTSTLPELSGAVARAATAAAATVAEAITATTTIAVAAAAKPPI
jgi:hypothetical protein